MKARWQALLERLDAMQVRERALLFTAVIVAILFCAEAFFLAPARQALKIERSRIADQQARLSEIDARSRILEAQSRKDPDAQARERIEILRGEIEEVRRGLGDRMSELISPAEMTRVLQAFVPRGDRLSLEAVRSLPAQPLDIGAVPVDNNEEAKTALFKRSVELELYGNYEAMVAYLKTLDALPWRIGWDMVSIRVEAYPNARFVLRMYTLSLEEGWIGV